MRTPEERIQFIAEYISAYEEKVKLLNKNGLFDTAKLFELFAIEVGSLYLGQRLSNLNITKYTYPCVDLISEDKKIYIQVSTAENIPAKIRATLESLRDSKRDEISTLTNVKFFVLNNSSVDKVKDYVGDDKIGSISFTRENDLITTYDILQKAMNSLDFQCALYNLLRRQIERIEGNSYKLEEAIENSKNVGLRNIDCKINNEYEIDHSKLISKIKSDDCKNISIQGEAGSGKSVLCKKIVEEDELLVYARAERFCEETDINKIWGFNVRETLELLNDKPIVFFIDSLEFIADIPTKLDLLCSLYEYTKQYPTIKIITSCRTSDKNAFIKVERNYNVCVYEMPSLTIPEQSAIAKKYPIIKAMLDLNQYAELLKSPFYINLIVSKITDVDNITDENQLRDYIWQSIICLNDGRIKKVIESIVFTRAKEFSLGVSSIDYDSGTIKKLISEGVLISNGKTVRLKYDIFEDICFEQYLDAEFDKCKGRYYVFFEEIEKFKRCIYRRYQIWISNKLLAKNNREKFLFELVFSDKMPQKWKKQTEIGLVKSRFCGQFFSEYGETIISSGMIIDFIKITNIYAFEINNDFFAQFAPYIQLKPFGGGRKSLISIIAEKELYKNDDVIQTDLEKLCSDYARIGRKEMQTAREVCFILESIINKNVHEYKVSNRKKTDDVQRMLIPIYQMAEYSKEWVKRFWNELSICYKDKDGDKKQFAQSVIKYTIKCIPMNLAEYLPIELCNLAEMFWTYPIEDDFRFYQRDMHGIVYQYGLNKNASEYENDFIRDAAIMNNFFSALFKRNFWIGLNWTIEFINKSVIELAKNQNGLRTYEIYFIEDEVKRSYLGLPDMWMAMVQEHSLPLIISDLLYCLKEELRDVIENAAVKNKEKLKFAENVRQHIYEKSNNIALLSIVAVIGIEFWQKLPGYSLDLATNISIVLCDMTRITSVPFSNRYVHEKEDVNQNDLLNYVRNAQICYEEKIKMKCYKILDYLYSMIPNDEENALAYLQIQKMDIRTAQFVKLDDTSIAIIPMVTGEAKKITDENEKQRQPEQNMALLINGYNEKMSKGIFTLDDCVKTVEILQDTREKCTMPSVFDKNLVELFVFGLKDKNLDYEIRQKFCQIWIDKIRNSFSGYKFIFEYSRSLVLFSQIEMEISNEIKEQIEELILDTILFREQNYVVSKIACYAKQYLISNAQLANAFFNTIIKLAEDEMNHQKYNAEYVKKYRPNEKIEFSPNRQPKLLGVDLYIDKDKREKYESQRDKIINEYLFNGSVLDLSNFNMDNYDITTVCYAVNCVLGLDDSIVSMIAKKLIIEMINVWDINRFTYHSFPILDSYSLYEVMKFFNRELLSGKRRMLMALDILFKETDFSIFTDEAIEFYQDIFGVLLAEYFDAYSDRERRSNCENIIYELENRILSINSEKVKIDLYKSLMLSITTYGGSGDWSKCLSGYSYQDKQFLNTMFSKYGKYHLKEMLDTICKLHINKLLPEILLSVRDSFASVSQGDKQSSDKIVGIVRDKRYIILTMITKTYLDFSDQVKQDDDLIKAFEEILEMLIEMGYEEAATILDEFRVH